MVRVSAETILSLASAPWAAREAIEGISRIS
jgi:hypothetical protein